MGFDEQVVRPDDRELVELESQFVCVRILRMNDVDLALFQFDYDLTWMGFFLNSDHRIYSRYGGRDGKSDEGRLSIKGLKLTMKRVLEAHKDNAKKKPAVAPHKPKRPKDLFAVKGKDCMHCHQVWEGLRDRQREEKTFDPATLYVYPLPENIGVELDVHAGNRVTKVLANSPAAQAKLEAGDELRRVGGVNVLAQGDVQWGLHNAPLKGMLTVEVVRMGEARSMTLELPAGWRKTDLDWRQSILQEAKFLK
ncbi:MAG: PDZ domain-containing protein [Gemmataceae bacterium]|nr:PDZ domain-containing protein [Gemmataceae bacterium]